MKDVTQAWLALGTSPHEIYLANIIISSETLQDVSHMKVFTGLHFFESTTQTLVCVEQYNIFIVTSDCAYSHFVKLLKS